MKEFVERKMVQDQIVLVAGGIPLGAQHINLVLQEEQDEQEAVENVGPLAGDAKTNLEALVDQLPENPFERIGAVKRLLEMLVGMDHLELDYYLGLIKNKTGIKLPVLKRQLKDIIQLHKCEGVNIPDQSPVGEPKIMDDPVFIKAGMDMVNGVMVITQSFRMRYSLSDGDMVDKSEPKLITSDRQLLSYPKPKGYEHEIATIDIGKGMTVAIKNSAEDAETRWEKNGSYSINEFLKGKEEPVDMGALYCDIESRFRRHFHTVFQGDYLICSLYIIMTYFHKLFMSIPFLHLNGEGGSGKSTLAKLFEILSFNGKLIVDSSPASLYRTAEATQMTAIMDEEENVNTRAAAKAQNNQTRMAFLKSRYQQHAYITRIGGTFETFGPTILCNINGLEDILAQRTILIQTLIVPKQIKEQIAATQPILDSVFKDIRNRLYCAAMQYYWNIDQLAKADTRDITGGGRKNEIFHPLITLASFIDTFGPDLKIEERLKETIKSKLELISISKVRSPEDMLKAALSDLLAKKKQNKPGGSYSFHTNEILEAFYEISGAQEYLKPQWIGDKLRLLCIFRDSKDSKRAIGQDFDRNPRTFKPTTSVPTNKKLTYYTIRYDRIS